jgi:protein-tyrosine phosphatase
VIDLHSHLLPGIDDGASDLNVSLEMARIAVANGVTIQACTPHILPGVYNNVGPQIRLATLELQRHLDEHGIPLRLVTGADAHVTPHMVSALHSGAILSLADTRYVLVEPPHHVAPPRLECFFFELLAAGYVPILTHPERLTWIETHYAKFVQLFRAGVWMQITSGSLTGAFGRRPRYWAERMLNEALVQILATDAHGARRRPPDLAEGRAVAAKWLGEEEAEQMVSIRPRAILENLDPSEVSAPPGGGEGGVAFGDHAADARVAARPSSLRPSRRHRERVKGAGDKPGRSFPEWLNGLFKK